MKPVVIDLFAGAGGFGLGFQRAGFEVTHSLEIDKWACDTLRFNNLMSQVIEQDIRDFDTASKIKQVCSFSPSVIIGGPPCQGFSISGAANKDPKDPRNALFQDFARWVKVLKPEAFILENVKGILSRRNANGENVVEIIRETFEHLGYCVTIWVLNAAEYGVPQTRERVFIVGTTSKYLSPPPKTHQLMSSFSETAIMFPALDLPRAITLWEAISDLPELTAGEGQEEQEYTHKPESDYQWWARLDSHCLRNHVAMEHSGRLVERFKQIKWGESSADVSEEYGPRQRNSNGKVSSKAYDQNNRRLYPHKPSHTIAASFYANFIHPFQHRNITAREGARIQSFPDTYTFRGRKTVVSHKLLTREGRHAEAYLCQYNQIGNAVPPLLAQRIAEHLLKEYFNVSA